MSSAAAMVVPTPPVIKKLERISPTIYEAAIKCTSRAAWLAGGDRKLLPAHPQALLGIGVHAVLERAKSGGIVGATEDERRGEAERIFDEKMRVLFTAAHPLLHAKFEGSDRLPFYNLYRARAAQMALDAIGVIAPSIKHQTASVPSSGPVVEVGLVSKDGRVSGRVDFLDLANQTVIDYKTGGDTGPISESEMRQLRLYAFLAGENGMIIRRGVIERADRTSAEVAITPDQAAEEGGRALEILDQYNRRAGESFSNGASPSQQACRFCPCIPFCDAFWNTAKVEWLDQCGTHAEGVVESVEGGDLVSINLNVTRGTTPRGAAVITRLSREWLTFAGADLPGRQETIRVTDAAYVADSTAPSILRADRMMTAVWAVPSLAPGSDGGP
ncbi:MAG: PD-(D/E)XK nuclease family protein [Steroidobacteraceae bacterium]